MYFGCVVNQQSKCLGVLIIGRTSNSICEQCGKQFYKRPTQKANSANDFCSMLCYGKWKIKTKNCVLCGKEFHPHRREQRFCSVSCAASRPRQEKWNGAGKSKVRKLLGTLSELGWDGSCMICGCAYLATIDLHRIVNGKHGGIYAIDNLCALCPNHHAEVHRLKYQLIRIDSFVFAIANPRQAKARVTPS